MDRIRSDCAGLDVHRDTVVAAVRDRDGNAVVETYPTTTRQLGALADRLDGAGVALVGMEATGVYWKPVFAVLEDRFECWLLNAAHIRYVPGRKTDVADAQWILELLEHGLVRPSLVPPQPIRDLRDLTRHRKVVVTERASEAQRLHKVLEDAGIKLASYTARVLSVSGRDMIEAFIAGETDPVVLAEMARGRMRPKIPQLVEALEGRWSTHHSFMARAILDRIDGADATIERLSGEIERILAPHQHHVALLKTIPGVDQRTAEVILAECGTDMSRFPTAGHLASWAGMCPSNNESAGKHRSGRIYGSNRWLRRALVEAAHAAARTKNTRLAGRYHRIRGRRGPAIAAVATGHTILVCAWHMLTNNEPYHDLGGDYYNTHNTIAYQRRLVSQIERMGYTVTLTPTNPA